MKKGNFGKILITSTPLYEYAKMRRGPPESNTGYFSCRSLSVYEREDSEFTYFLEKKKNQFLELLHIVADGFLYQIKGN